VLEGQDGIRLDPGLGAEVAAGDFVEEILLTDFAEGKRRREGINRFGAGASWVGDDATCVSWTGGNDDCDGCGATRHEGLVGSR